MSEAGQVRRFRHKVGGVLADDDSGELMYYTDYEASERRVKELEAENASLRELVMHVHVAGYDVWVEPVRNKYWIQARNEIMEEHS